MSFPPTDVPQNPIPGTVFAEAFYLFETSGAESVPREVLGDLLRAVGQNPTQAQVDYMVSAASAQVDYDEFMRTVNRPGGFANEGTKQDKVNRAIEVFDKDGDGKISGPQLHYVLVWLAEKKMGAEQEELIVRAHDLEYKSYLENL
ncbi:hypothetical protein C8J57DRAFT_1046912 [Mycena rebaudengoi]|nr:hypothetical protein C8J57DRAFT_1046912 [Mycena rebaudengoi]